MLNDNLGDEWVQPRPVIGSVVGLAVAIGCLVGFTMFGNAIGAMSEIQLDEPVTIQHGGGTTSWEEETDTLTTWYGQMTLCLSIVLAIWAGYATCWRRLDAGWSAKDWILFRVWVCCLAALSVLAALSELVFPKECGFWLALLRTVLTYGLTIGVGLAGYRWYEGRIQRIKSTSFKDA